MSDSMPDAFTCISSFNRRNNKYVFKKGIEVPKAEHEDNMVKILQETLEDFSSVHLLLKILFDN